MWVGVMSSVVSKDDVFKFQVRKWQVCVRKMRAFVSFFHDSTGDMMNLKISKEEQYEILMGQNFGYFSQYVTS